jgi:hypothetical protein
MNELHSKYGRKIWTFSAGCIPLHSTGYEPTFTSHDKIAVLNVTDQEAQVEMQILYENREPIKGYSFTVLPKRLRKIRFNDLIDPFPIPLESPFGFILQSTIDIIVQFSRMDTASPYVTGFCVTPFYLNGR